MSWAGQVCGWGRCPSARVAERMGAPALDRGPSCPPSRDGLQFPAEKTSFPRLPRLSAAPTAPPGGSRGGNPGLVRSCLEPCGSSASKLVLEVLLFHVGRIKRTEQRSRGRVVGRLGVTSRSSPLGRHELWWQLRALAECLQGFLRPSVHPLLWSSPFQGDCGWREGERQLESVQASWAARGWGD